MLRVPILFECKCRVCVDNLWPLTPARLRWGGLHPSVRTASGSRTISSWSSPDWWTRSCCAPTWRKASSESQQPGTFSQSIYLLPKEPAWLSCMSIFLNLQPSGRTLTPITHDWHLLTDVKCTIRDLEKRTVSTKFKLIFSCSCARRIKQTFRCIMCIFPIQMNVNWCLIPQPI